MEGAEQAALEGAEKAALSFVRTYVVVLTAGPRLSDVPRQVIVQDLAEKDRGTCPQISEKGSCDVMSLFVMSLADADCCSADHRSCA